MIDCFLFFKSSSSSSSSLLLFLFLKKKLSEIKKCARLYVVKLIEGGQRVSSFSYQLITHHYRLFTCLPLTLSLSLSLFLSLFFFSFPLPHPLVFCMTFFKKNFLCLVVTYFTSLFFFFFLIWWCLLRFAFFFFLSSLLFVNPFPCSPLCFHFPPFNLYLLHDSPLK